MNKSRSLITIGMVALLLLSASVVFGQTNPKDGYLEFTGENQSRNLPAGTVSDPSSHLSWIVDTGINVRDLANDVDLTDAQFAVPVLDHPALQPLLDGNGDGELDPGAIYQNFLAISNTHPTQAVTIHFRYFNDNCEDVLDFLVVLTCNDTLMFDPFNFPIPKTGENTRTRFFEEIPGRVLRPIPVSQWGSGRFIVTAAASGTTIDEGDNPEILFPYEFRDLDDECNIEADGSLSADDDGLTELEDILSGFDRNVGTSGGLVTSNLHVFNASQISFNYLIGNGTAAIPGGFLSGPAGVQFAAYGIDPWGRPAIDRDLDLDISAVTGNTDGDGPQATNGKIVLGAEVGYQSDRTSRVAPNNLYLRNEVHGGDIQFDPTFGQQGGATTGGGWSEYGALGSTPYHIADPSRIIQHFVSVSDDYNGSNNTGIVGAVDRASNLSPAATTYVLQIYDNNEDILNLEPDTPLNVSPPVIGETVDLKLTCICLRTWLTSTTAPGTNVDDVTIQEMADIFGPEVLNGKDAFDGLLVPAPADATDPFGASPDVSGGWVRYVRDNTVQVIIDQTEQAENGLTFSAPAHGPGTSTFDLEFTVPSGVTASLSDTGEAAGGFDPNGIDDIGPSFLTGAQQIVIFEGFAGAWWKYAVASDTLVSETGDPTP